MKVGRNEPCHCGSGKKYKKCCQEKDQAAAIDVSKLRDVQLPDFDEEWDKTHGEPVYSYPEYDGKDSVADSPYPEISEDEERLVDIWWDAYKEMDGLDTIRQHLDQFIAAHPELVENLGLEHEVIFELGGDYLRQDRYEEYIAFLKEFRVRFPQVYVRGAGYYDADIIAWHVAYGQRAEAADYFDYFVSSPEELEEHLYEVAIILRAVDATELYIELVERIRAHTDSMTDSNLFINMVYHILAKHIKPDFTESNVAQFLEEAKPYLNSKADFQNLQERWTVRFQSFMRPYAPWPIDPKANKADQFESYYQITDNFTRYMQEKYNISWVTADFYSDKLYDYLVECYECKKGKKPFFDFSHKTIDSVAYSLGQSFNIFLDPATVLGILNAIHYFADYLVACAMINEEERNKIQSDTLKIHNVVYPNLRKSMIEAHCFSKFPIWG